MIEIDGSILEGGGQILRIALSLSCILRKPVHIFNIRAGRSKPGLAAQHLKGCHLLTSMSKANTEGLEMGSTYVKFIPQQTWGGRFDEDIQTAGSISLLLQAALPVAIFSNTTSYLYLKGGTNAEMAPQIDFMNAIFLPNLERFGASFRLNIIRRGFFPKGGGNCKIRIEPVKLLRTISLVDFGEVNEFFGWSFVAGVLPVTMAREMENGAKNVLTTLSNAPIDLKVFKESKEMAPDSCSAIILGCSTTTGCLIGSSALGKRNEATYETGKKAAIEIASCVQSKACIDRYVQDQLIIYMALATGTSRIKTVLPTLHTRTAIHVVELMCNARFKILKNSDENSCIIECQGIGFVNDTIE